MTIRPKRRRTEKMKVREASQVRCPGHLQWIRGCRCIIDDANAAQDSAKNNPPNAPRNQAANTGARKAPAKPEVPHVQVAQDKDGNPDRQSFADDLKAEINKAPDVATVNELVKVHNGAISNLKNVAPDLCKSLEETTKLRRSDLAQARAAAE